MASFKINHLFTLLVGVAVASASLLVAADPASAEGALFRAKRTWWFSQAGSWTDGGVIPPTGMSTAMDPYEPSAVAQVGTTPNNPAFTAPKSLIKDTTYTFMCGPGTFQCYIGYPKSSGWYSYWNAKGSFRPQNPYAPTTTTTVRVRTVSDGWPGPAVGPPTAMYTRVTPTEGGCTGSDCPWTTQFGGRYYASRGGSIMIQPGPNRFGGTMRFFGGPNARYYQLITISGPWTSVTFPPGLAPTSQQRGTGDEFTVGEVEAQLYSRGYRYRLTEPDHINRLITGMTPGGGACTQVTAPPNNTGMCAYYQKTAQYMTTRAPYTTGMVQAWQPNGNTNTIQTATGYDNRTTMGLNGTVSMVHPRLIHTYLISPSSGDPIRMSWSSSRMRKIDFRFAPEPTGVAMLAAGFVTLAGLYRLRRR